MRGARREGALRAGAGKLERFTGIVDPYEPPAAPALVLSTDGATLQANVARLLGVLSRSGIVAG